MVGKISASREPEGGRASPWRGPTLSHYYENHKELEFFVAFVAQKSYCTVIFAVRAVSTSFGTSHAPFGT
jgi:hypothetical protein